MNAAFYCSEVLENPSHIYGKPFDLQVTRFEDSDEVPEAMYGRKLVEVVHDLPVSELETEVYGKRLADTRNIEGLVYSVKPLDIFEQELFKEVPLFIDCK